ncbi:hypothetical protein [Spartinivicinus ruber]|uniref:hypothetical protein n=1 Tax=Spartinivicinus ruber TaxID=2683272 RepID=UPI0013D72B81|nr:hypothetical protein [Spartinivicinus ruber]
MNNKFKHQLTVVTTSILISNISLAANITASRPFTICTQDSVNARCGSFGTIRGVDENIDEQRRNIDWDISFTFALMKTKNFKNESDYHFWIQSAGRGIGITNPRRETEDLINSVFGPLLSFSLQTNISHDGNNTIVLERNPENTGQSISISKSYGVSGTLGSSPSGGVNASVSNSVSHEQRLVSATESNQGNHVTHKITYTPDKNWHYYSSSTDWSGVKYVRNIPLDINNVYTFEGLKIGDNINYNYKVNNLKATTYFSGPFSNQYFTRSVYSFNTTATPIRDSFTIQAF